MTTVYKLTDHQLRTYGGYQWVPGEWHETDGTGDLCGPGWLHGYDHPLIAVLHNPLHGDYRDYLLWEGEGEGQRRDDHGLKCGYTRLRLLRQIPIPAVTTQQRVRYAIGAALAVYPDLEYLAWATGWLAGCQEAELAARAAALAAAWAAEAAARAAASAARAAALAAAWAAALAGAPVTRDPEAEAGAVAVRAATTATTAARARRAINLIAIAEWAVTDSTTPPFLAGAA